MWDELTDDEIAAEMLAASARIDAAHHALMSLAREQNRRWAVANRTDGAKEERNA